MHSALFLVLAFFTSAGIWLLLEAEFLAIVLVLVYVGAVMVLFLFVVMMLDVNLAPLREGFIRYLPVGAAVAAVVVVEIALVIGASGFDLGSMPPPPPHEAGYSNTKELGALLYTVYVYPFEIAGAILLVRHRRGHRADHAAPERGQDPGPGPAGPGAARGPRAPRADAGRETRTRLRPMIPALPSRCASGECRPGSAGGSPSDDPALPSRAHRADAGRETRAGLRFDDPVLPSRALRADAGRETRTGPQPMIPLSHFIILGAILFCISMAGVFLNRKNVIVLLMSIELILLSVNLNFVAFSRFLDDTAGQVFVFFILTVAAAEAAIGLAILVVLFRKPGHDQRRGSGYGQGVVPYP